MAAVTGRYGNFTERNWDRGLKNSGCERRNREETGNRETRLGLFVKTRTY